jgi:hypothetical protein
VGQAEAVSERCATFDRYRRDSSACSLDLYARVFDGRPLGDDEYVISFDEKTSIQARCRCHPTLPPGTSCTMRVSPTTSAVARWPTWPPATSTVPR